jgi:hypothetical protein
MGLCRRTDGEADFDSRGLRLHACDELDTEHQQWFLRERHSKNPSQKPFAAKFCNIGLHKGGSIGARFLVLRLPKE